MAGWFIRTIRHEFVDKTRLRSTGKFAIDVAFRVLCPARFVRARAIFIGGRKRVEDKVFFLRAAREPRRENRDKSRVPGLSRASLYASVPRRYRTQRFELYRSKGTESDGPSELEPATVRKGPSKLARALQKEASIDGLVD